jgi:hypothetical protein
MPEEKTRTCSTRAALADMLESASRRLNRALSPTGGRPGISGEDAMQRAKAAVDSLKKRLAAHCEAHHC